jgi:outer membrane protein with beta-barrel domain
MKARTLSFTLALLTAGGVSQLAAQSPRFSVGGGLTIPAGGYGTADGAGWHVLGAALLPLSMPHIGLRVDAMYGRTPRQGLETGHTTLAGATASVVWRLRRDGPNLRPYVLTGLGIYNVGVTRAGLASASRTGIAWSGGAGLSLLGVGPALGFAEVRVITIRTSGGATNLFPLSVGFALRER